MAIKGSAIMDPSGLIRGMRLLDDIAQDYERTEITTVFLHDRSVHNFLCQFYPDDAIPTTRLILGCMSENARAADTCPCNRN
jgi:hypothetical protein